MKRERERGKIIDRSYIRLNWCEGGTTRDNPIYRAPAFDHQIRAGIIAFFQRKTFLIDQIARRKTNEILTNGGVALPAAAA